MLEMVFCGITFRISLLFPAAVIFLMSWDSSGVVLLCLAASLLHELGHILMMLIVHDRTCRVTMSLFGICIEREPSCQLGYGKAAAVSLTGPIMNVICGLLLWYSGYHAAACLHAGLAAFNLLPVYSLDGGEALYALLCLHFPELIAMRVLRILSLSILVITATLGLMLLVGPPHNFSLLFISGYLFFLQKKH